MVDVIQIDNGSRPSSRLPRPIMTMNSFQLILVVFHRDFYNAEAVLTLFVLDSISSSIRITEATCYSIIMYCAKH